MQNADAATPPAMPGRVPPLTVVAFLGFSSGLPLALTGSTLQAWMTATGIDLTTIGAMSLVGLPYLYKFLWAPLLDRYALFGGQRRRSWLLSMQILLACCCYGLAVSDPAVQIGPVIALVVLIAWLSATQDIAVDAWRAEVLPAADRGVGAGVSVAGYRLAMIVSGAGVLVMADIVGFDTAFRCLAGLMIGIALCTWWGAVEPGRVTRAPASLWVDLRDALRALRELPAIWGLLGFVTLYKLGDAFAGSLTMSFFLRGQGFSLTEIGATYKAIGIGASLVGGIAGGLWMRRLGLYRSLWWFGWLQAITNLGFLALALTGKHLFGMIAVVALENLSGGMGTSALVALLIGACDRRFTATHFALLSALASLSRVLIGPVAGAVAERSWSGFFAWSVALAVPGLVWLWWLRTRLPQFAPDPVASAP